MWLFIDLFFKLYIRKAPKAAKAAKAETKKSK